MDHSHGIRELLAADYRALYRDNRPSGRQGALVALARFVTNPSLQAVTMLRLAGASPRGTAWLWRQLLLSRFAIDWSHRTTIGPGLTLPHPVGIVLAGVVGRNVAIGQNVTLGGNYTDRDPVLGDEVIVYPGAVIVSASIGAKTRVGTNSCITADVGRRSIIGANTHIHRDLPERSVVTSDSTERLKPSG